MVDSPRASNYLYAPSRHAGTPGEGTVHNLPTGQHPLPVLSSVASAALWQRPLRAVLQHATAARSAGNTLKPAEAYAHTLLQVLDAIALALAHRDGRLANGGPLPLSLSCAEGGARLAIPSLLAQLPASPHAALTAAYQYALSLHPQRRDDGSIRLMAHRAARRSTGVFYTPVPVADWLLHRALAPLAIPTPRVLDPAMGTGTLLLAAIRLLAGRLGVTPAEAAEQYVFGVDTDPVAVTLAILGLWLETGARPAVLHRHLRCADALMDLPNTSERYDTVVVNPPWGVRLSAVISDPPHFVDSFKPFISLALQLSSGTVGLILPQAMLEQDTHSDVRALLLAHLAPYSACRLGHSIFPNAAAPSCALVFGPRPGPPAISCLDQRTGEHHSSISATRWTAARFSLAPTDLLDLLHRLVTRHPTLGDLPHLYRVRDVGINYNRASVARRSLYVADTAEDPRDLPRFRGRDFARYTSVAQSGWLRYDVRTMLQEGESFSLSDATCALLEKIILRQTADRIVATLDRSQMVWGRSVLAIIAEGDASLQALLACLNSRLLTVLYRTLAGEEGRILPQVKVSRLHALPIPVPFHDDSERSDSWTTLDGLSRVMLRDAGSNPTTDQTIDALVYRLYGLSDREIAVVEGAT